MGCSSFKVVASGFKTPHILCILLQGQGKISLSVKVLWASVEGPCLHSPRNWLVRQLNDEPKPVYKVGFISEKGKATAREAKRSLEAGSSLLR
jgi:hypothetical protein